MPRLDGPAQLQVDIADVHIAVVRKAELLKRRQPLQLEGQAVLVQVGHHVLHVRPHVVRHHETVVQQGAPAHEVAAVGRLPETRHEAAQQQHLYQCHVGVRGHLETPEFQQAQAPRGRAGGIQFVDAELGPVGVAGDVDQQVAQQAVHDPGLGFLATVDLAEGDLQLVQHFIATLVHAGRLAGGPQEEAGKQVGQAGVVLPVGNQALQQVRAAQQRAVLRTRRAQGNVIATAGARVATVEHELLGAQAGLARLLVQGGGVVHQLAPAVCRVNIDLDDAGVGGDKQPGEARVARGLVALDHDR